MRRLTKQEYESRQEWLLDRVFELEVERNAALEREAAARERAEKAENENFQLKITLNIIRSVIEPDKHITPIAESADDGDGDDDCVDSEFYGKDYAQDYGDCDDVDILDETGYRKRSTPKTEVIEEEYLDNYKCIDDEIMQDALGNGYDPLSNEGFEELYGI